MWNYKYFSNLIIEQGRQGNLTLCKWREDIILAIRAPWHIHGCRIQKPHPYDHGLDRIHVASWEKSNGKEVRLLHSIQVTWRLASVRAIPWLQASPSFSTCDVYLVALLMHPEVTTIALWKITSQLSYSHGLTNYLLLCCRGVIIRSINHMYQVCIKIFSENFMSSLGNLMGKHW
jgi:hypothetical protein